MWCVPETSLWASANPMSCCVDGGFAYIVWIKCPHKDIKIEVTYIVHEENGLVNKQS